MDELQGFAAVHAVLSHDVTSRRRALRLKWRSAASNLRLKERKLSRVTRSPEQRTSPDAETMLGAFVAKFDLAHQRLLGDVRAALRRRFPAAHELVYDNYNYFVFGYSGDDDFPAAQGLMT